MWGRAALAVDGGARLASIDVAGDPSGRACPAESTPTDPVQTPVTTTVGQGVQWLTFAEDGYAVVPEGGEGARIVWTPGRSLAHWFGGDPDAVLRSDVLPLAEAQQWLDGALREPMGVAVQHRTATDREHFEGHKLRGVAYCERVYAQDIEQRFRDGAGTDTLGPPLRITVTRRSPATADRCTPE